MKRYSLVYIILLFAFSNIYSQKYSSDKIKKMIFELNEQTIDTVYFDYQKKEVIKFDKPKLEYYVNDNLTGNVISRNPNFSDNEMYSLFLKIYKKGNCEDFKIMCSHKNPAIRIYGFFAFLISKNYYKAEIYLKREEKISENIWWNSLGCELNQLKTHGFMKERLVFLRKTKKYKRKMKKYN